MSFCKKENWKTKEEWLQLSWGDLNLDPNQELPTTWGPFCKSYFKFICKCGKTRELKFSTVTKGDYVNCARCNFESKAYWLDQKWGSLHLDPNQVLPEEWPSGSGKKFNFLCDCGRESKPVFNLLFRNPPIQSCGKCRNQSKDHWLSQKWGKLKLDPDQDLPDEWGPAPKSRFKFICECGNSNFYPVFNDVITGKNLSCGCAQVGVGEGSVARDIFKELLTIYPDAAYNERRIIYPLELDIYLPSLKTAVEYHGLFWHSENNCKGNPIKDYQKYLKCLEKGIRLIQVYEGENWKLLLEPLLKTKKIRCKPLFRFGSFEESSTFLSKKHYLGGNSVGTHYVIAELEGKVIGVWVFKKRGDGILEWTRACWDHDYKTWNPHEKALNLVKEGYSQIVSFSDNRLHTGELYQKLGFKLVKELAPAYWYTDRKTRVHKSAFRVPAGVDEKEYARERGWSRIWDSGKKKWVLEV